MFQKGQIIILKEENTERIQNIVSTEIPTLKFVKSKHCTALHIAYG